MAGPENKSDQPNPGAAKSSAAGAGDATSYVGSPAVGTSRAAAAAGVAAIGPDDSQINERRRRLVWSAVTAFLAAWFIAFLRFFLPRTLFEPPTIFKIGYPSDYALGVDTKWQQKYRIWVDRTPDRVFVIYARCTHLGCTPDWKASENKFKEAAMTARASISRGPRRVPWTARTWNWLPMGKLSSIHRGSISGPRDSRVILVTRVRICRRNGDGHQLYVQLELHGGNKCLKRRTPAPTMASRSASSTGSRLV
jgi:hypothetical protein